MKASKPVRKDRSCNCPTRTGISDRALRVEFQCANLTGVVPMARQARRKQRRQRRPGRHVHANPARGRPSKLAEQRILESHAHKLAEIFRLSPLRNPVDPAFDPYYQQVLHGNAGAVLKYCDQHWEQGDLSGSFFEFVGRLFTISFYRVAHTILSNIKRRRVSGVPSKQRVYEYWYRRILKPRCESARSFIRDAYKLDSESCREKVWEGYCFQPAWRLQTDEDRQHHEKRKRAIQELVDASDPPSSSLINTVNGFGSFNLVPKSIFFDLAVTQRRSGRRSFRDRPAQVTRRYACRITGISESTASHYRGVSK
jgi:hypothetical protein